VVDENTEQPAEQPAENTAEQPAKVTPEQPHADHHIKEDLRDAVAKAVGIAVEAGSMLAGHSGEYVSAEGKVAENDTEEFIDRIDGEG
jgi:hypothetical protein